MFFFVLMFKVVVLVLVEVFEFNGFYFGGCF